MMTKILVPTDFSPTAETAFRFAVDLSESIGGEVVLFHVYTPLENPFIESEENREKYNKDTRLELEKELESLKSKVTRGKDSARVSIALGRSPITDTILEYAKEHSFSLIIMGTQGASGLQKVVIGSEAGRVIDNTSVPVLLVPEKFSGTLPREVAFVTTREIADKKPLTMVLELTQVLDSKVTIIHISDDERDNNITASHYDDVISRYSENRNIEFKQFDDSYEVDTMEDIDEKIPYDMMVMIKRKKSFLERLFQKSLSRNMAYLTDHPLLIIPEETM